MALTKVSYSMVNTTEIHVIDYGAVGDGVTDDTTAIQNAINAGDLIYFDAGKTYKITTPLDLSVGDKTLLGNGAIINQESIVSGDKWAVKAIGGLSLTTSNLTVNAVATNYSVTVASTTGFAIGDWVLLHSDAHFGFYNSVSYLVDVGEFLRIRGISGSIVTFTTPIVNSEYNTTDTARITKADFCENITIDGLVFQGSNIAGNAERGLVLQYVNGFSVQNCTFNGQDIYQCELTMSIRGVVTTNKFYGVFYDGVIGTIFYGVAVLDSSQYINIGDNIFERVRHAVITSAKSTGQNAWGQPLYINIHHNQMLDAMAGGAGRSWGFQHHGFGLYVSFNNNLVNGGYGGISVDAGFGVDVLDNVFTNLTIVGIELGNAAILLGNIVVSGNHISKEVNDAVSTTIGIIVSDAIVTSVTDVIISNNFIIGFDGPGSIGVYVGNTPTCRNVVVKNNTISTSTAGQDTDSGYAIVDEAPNIEIIGNTVCNYFQGIFVGSSADRSVVKNNIVRFDAPPTGGFSIYDNSSSVVIDCNTLIRPYVGVRVDVGSNKTLVTNNTMIDVVSATVSNAGTLTVVANNNSS